ncbi:hypothetical protein DAEQUDRAFT_370591 [Daedalea quercina L-15889]|uniref:F-box domain-containing protein n=1 Tax=Daedalea quercina L-15889 TaxID=1314783 RepID=A0A165PB93_9APHY|nr:hypothetical protein DAEQUDRAFT_370591 [Daedalea quercina L-15889]
MLALLLRSLHSDTINLIYNNVGPFVSIHLRRLPWVWSFGKCDTQNHWPRLRDLHIHGELELDPDHHLPFVTLLAGMPKLRVLKLHLFMRRGADKRILQLWPKGYEGCFPWPDLDDLTMSFPSPEDQIYCHFPHTMRRLSLRCFPHHCFYLWETEMVNHLHLPVLYASEMLEIISKINAPHLDYLQLEYRADAAEGDFLDLLSRKFPRMTFLEIHRFHSPRASDATAHDIASQLAKLSHLKTLRANLDFEHTADWWSGNPNRVEIVEMLQQTAATLASTLAQQDVMLWLLRRVLSGATWVLFHPADRQDPARGLRMEIHRGGERMYVL